MCVAAPSPSCFPPLRRAGSPRWGLWPWLLPGLTPCLQMIRLVSPELLARVVRLQGWDFDALPMGRLAPLSDQTLCYVQTAHGPPTHAQQLVLLPAGPHGTDVLMLVPLLMECAPGTLLVSEAAFRRLALGAPLGSLLFACQGGFLAVRCVCRTAVCLACMWLSAD